MNTKKKHTVYLCHACHNGKCSNPVHLYWGTPLDNGIDATENGLLKTVCRARVIKRKNPQRGEKNSMYGKHHTEETKQKIRESLRRTRLEREST